MKNNPVPDGDKTTGSEFTQLFGGAKVVLDETPKSVTPFGGLASFIVFLQRIGFAGEVQKTLPFAAPTSPNAIPLAHTLTAFIMGVVTGASRFAHTDWLRGDRALHAVLGIARFPGTDTVRHFFLRFTQCHIQAFWRPLWKWLLSLLSCPGGGFHLDLDSTVFQRSGGQEGAARGYNPRRPGRNSHHPLLAVLAEAPFILHGWLRSGNAGAARGAAPFLREYNGRATVEQRIEELKNDLAADGFCLQQFYGTEAAFLAVLFTFNLMSLYQHMTTPQEPYRQPATLRAQVFVAGAILARAGKQLALRLSQAWGGLAKHKPLLEAVLQWPKLTSPKLAHPQNRMAAGGGFV